MITYNIVNRRALVTGSASGIGLATATLLAKSGATVAMNDLPDNPALAFEVDKLVAEGFDVFAAPGNTGTADQATEMVKAAIERMGGLDYLVNNAATPGTNEPIPPADFVRQDEAFFEKLMSVNVQGPLRCTAAAVDALRDGGGAIVNTASTAGLRGDGSSAIYAATKAALIMLTNEHARGLGPDIRVNAVAPGIVESTWDCRFNPTQETIDALPLQRIGQPEDYAEVIVYLLVGGQYITGQTVVVDGGLLAGARSV